MTRALPSSGCSGFNSSMIKSTLKRCPNHLRAFQSIVLMFDDRLPGLEPVGREGRVGPDRGHGGLPEEHQAERLQWAELRPQRGRFDGRSHLKTGQTHWNLMFFDRSSSLLLIFLMVYWGCSARAASWRPIRMTRERAGLISSNFWAAIQVSGASLVSERRERPNSTLGP